MNTPLSSTEMCDAAGITYRQLDFWIRAGVIAPAYGHAQGSGSRRRFEATEVRYLRFAFAVMTFLNTNRFTGPATSSASSAIEAVRQLPPFEGIVYVTHGGGVSREFPSDEEACIAVNLDVCRRAVMDELRATVGI